MARGRPYRGRVGIDKMPKKPGPKPKDWDPVTNNIIQQKFLAVIPDVRYDHPDLYKPGKYTPAQKIAAATAYMVEGNYQRASNHCGVPPSTIRQWKNTTEWWPVLTQQLRKEEGDELDSAFTRLIHTSTDQLEDRLVNGDLRLNFNTGELNRVPVGARTLSVVLSQLYDKRALHRGDPTSRVERITTEERLQRISTTFKQVAEADGVLIEANEDDNE